jgi:hypothetical protein
MEKLAFYVHGLSSYARMRHRQKAYVLTVDSKNTIFRPAQIQVFGYKGLEIQ